MTSAFSKEDVRFIGKDIRYIKQNQYKLQEKEASFFGSPMFWLSYIGSLLIFVIVFIVYRKKLRENANMQLVRNKKANKIARKRLKEAASFLKEQKAEKFYEAILKAFWGYVITSYSIHYTKLYERVADAFSRFRSAAGMLSLSLRYPQKALSMAS